MAQSELVYMLFHETTEPRALPLSLLDEITNCFSEDLEIGRGGFSVVYKGILKNGAIVAVKKRLSRSYMYDKEFQGEIECLMKVKHRNIVRLLGYCADTQGNVEMYNGKFVMAVTQQRMLCFEYLPNGSLADYIKDLFGGLGWTQRYNIIKGICEGLNYLHQKNILHLDLKPANVLLDENMKPKITDFGHSRCLEDGQTRVTATKVGGTLGYLAPEFTSREITHKFDLYSLGVIITELLTGKKAFLDVLNVLESWSKRSCISQWEQIRVCAEIGMECTNFNPAKRPASANSIIDRLLETESTQVTPEGEPSELLILHQFTLCFPFEPNKAITCPMQLTNNTDRHVVIRLTDKNNESLLRLPLYGIVPPRSPYTLIITTQELKELPGKSNMDLILDGTTMLDDDDISTFQRQPHIIFQKAKETGNMMEKVALKAFYTRQQEKTDSSKMGSEPHHLSFKHMGSKPHHVAFEHLKDITNNFCTDRILGTGSSSVVYKGVLLSGELVAVKKPLRSMLSSQKEFENEFNILMKLDHTNVVRVVGYCYETQHSHARCEGKFDFAWNIESLLCLECLPNGSLDKYISDASSGLDWHTRWKIIEGISFGLWYLHEQCNEPIVHLDLKPENILLDENMAPKIADFGVSRLKNQKQTISTTLTSGTPSYMPPEYVRGIATPMSDIFSFGVLIIEVITGHKDYPYDSETSSKGFIDHELQKWRNVLEKEPEYTSLEIDCQQIQRCIQIGLICMNVDRTKRPTMKKIIDMLQGLESMN